MSLNKVAKFIKGRLEAIILREAETSTLRGESLVVFVLASRLKIKPNKIKVRFVQKSEGFLKYKVYLLPPRDLMVEIRLPNYVGDGSEE